ncbi:Pumilio-like protein 12 [Hibiscus syriacus]|uniref:Pumilio-like protein 12 n=1 Tax=Hibiscus syriacus TaxID=106335 RepID=A0A6A2WJ38_HIBSY|nr:Pumilio-like protein 12 [Hibiscus syriacus]
MFKVGEKEKMMLIRDMKRNSELETLSSESPQTPPFLNRQHRSPVTRVSPSRSSSFSNGFPSPEKSLPFEDRPQQQPNFHHHRLWLDPTSLPVFHFRNKNANEKNWVDDGFGLCENLCQMHIGDEEIDGDDSAERRRSKCDPDGLGLSFEDVSSYSAGKYSSYEGFQSSPQQVPVCFDGNDVMRSAFHGLHGGNEKGDSLGSYGIGYNLSNDLVSKSSWHNNQIREQCRSIDNGGILLQNAFSARPYLDSPFVFSPHCGTDGNGGRGVINSLSSPRFLHSKVRLLDDHSVNIQGRDLKHGVDNSGHDSFKCFDGNDVTRSTLLGLHGGNEKGDSLGSYGIGYNQSNDLVSESSWYNNQRHYILDQRMEQCRSFDNGGILLQNAFSARPYLDNPFELCSQQCGMDGNGGRGVINSLSSPRSLHSKDPNVEDHSIIIQERDLKYGVDNLGHDSFKCHKKKCPKGIAMQNLKEKSPRIDRNHGENVRLMPSPYSLVEFRGCINYMAKDQIDSRFLQRIFDEGSYLDVQIIFNEIIDNIVELMMDPFGNYLAQKLLDVCTEEQRLQIVLMVTKEAGQLVRISLNTYGTRVVQKLVETLKSRQQISRIISALKPGILDLIKDLNGNHVLQCCLQCLDNEDNKIIFYAAAHFCVDIATHRHGCCVLQRCISHSNGQHRDNLITQISRNGLLLAQDPFGNYVVQYVIELKPPPAVANRLLSQFKGHYVHLSMQKFSSHVVEKCLKHFAESRSQIIRELISAVHFEQVLQDPFANYVIQSALAVTKGPLHDSLVRAVRPHIILRTSPYCKRIFSRNLLKK